jgi:hypothetical protein
MAKMYLNATTEDGELLERIEVRLSDDPQHPLGTPLHGQSLLLDIASAARIVLAREAAARQRLATPAEGLAFAERVLGNRGYAR